MGINETKSLCKSHKALIELDDFNALGTMNILRVAQLMSYPTYDVREDENYKYNAKDAADRVRPLVHEGSKRIAKVFTKIADKTQKKND